MVKNERIFNLTPGREPKGNIAYWMSREQRVSDNPGLYYAAQLALVADVRLMVVFTLTGNYPGAALRHYDFMIRGLLIVAHKLKLQNIPFIILHGDPVESLVKFVKEHDVGTVISDFDPLKIKSAWKYGFIQNSSSLLIEVDGHNIVPARYASDKLEFGAYTLRPKIHRMLSIFLEDFPELPEMKSSNYFGELFSPESILQSLGLDRSVPPVHWILPGEDNAEKLLQNFLDNKLADYAALKNDPNKDASSGLSPYLHFGQLSAQRIAMQVIRNYHADTNSEAFLEELIVRKELADNFCLYNKNYDNPAGFHEWAQKTHLAHEKDEREYLYSREQFENGSTHDPLWNAAQNEMINTGKMHGYMRMYWAKKILEWTKSVIEAMEIAIYLNDKYELDGRDPNGYAGIAWSLGGVHDRAWGERPVFGKIRYMNDKGCRRKFDVEAYIRRQLAP